jgi:uncharacterized protein
MGRSLFDPGYAELPERLPIFPLPGVLLLPGGRLPLNIFEPRYLAMTRRALAGSRLIGMIQPKDETAFETGMRPVYPVGCAGRIVSFSETDDGRYLITLAGLLRFRVEAELPRDEEGFRWIRPDYLPYRGDLAPDSGAFDRAALLGALKSYFGRHNLEADWQAIEKADDERLVTSLAMLCPFEASEKQVLLEAAGLTERAAAMTTILAMAVHQAGLEPDGPTRPN